MEEIKWRFKGNNYGPENGLDTADMETFKKDPIASLARESCQNAIDATTGLDEPVLVEFKSFVIKKNDIPGYTQLAEQIKSCINYQSSKNDIKTVKVLEFMDEKINQDEINCLRISDYNTKGLLGVRSDSGNFYLLTKGSGVTNKIGTSGGSKGIGKFASFVASSFNTVFYSTKTVDNEEAHLGICKLCSTTMKDTDEKTQGVGYYSEDEKNQSILSQLNLEEGYIRSESGTDIYILGFKKESTWMKEIVSQVLDSFIVAIYKNKLVIKIEKLTINSENLESIINNSDLIENKLYKSIMSQFLLLSADNILKTEINLDGYGTMQVYLKEFETDIATNNCTMVRYPYMKIKTINNISSIPCSALCIIEDDNLNKQLREIENPQHTDWEAKRIEDKDKRNIMYALLREIKKEISQFVIDSFSSSSNEILDVEGASDYLPESIELDNGEKENSNKINEIPKIVNSIRNINKSLAGKDYEPNSNTLIPEIGEHGDGDDSPTPDGHNNGGVGDPRDGANNNGFEKNGDNEVMKNVNLTGQKYRFFITDKEQGNCVISFESLYEESECVLDLFYLDDANKRYKIDILEAKINGEKCKIENGSINKLSLNISKKYKIEIKTSLNNLFAAEVKMYASR